MRPLLALGALLLLIGAFAALAPSSLVDARIASMTQERVRLADASGTAWRGRGVLADARGRWRVPIAWNVDGWALLRGALDVTLLPAEGASARGTLVAEGDRLQVSGLHAEVPAAALESAWQRPPVPRLEGTIALDAPRFASDGVRSDGAFDVRWTRASLALAGLRAALGTVEAHARPADEGLVIALSSTGGDVVVEGTAIARADGVSVDARLRPMPTLAPPVAVALRALGPADPDGAVHLTWQARR